MTTAQKIQTLKNEQIKIAKEVRISRNFQGASIRIQQITMELSSLGSFSL